MRIIRRLIQPKNKKITVKDYNENKKTVDDDKNVFYNVYVKYKAWYIVETADRDPNSEKYDFLSDNGD